jgi:hypothetical protein
MAYELEGHYSILVGGRAADARSKNFIRMATDCLTALLQRRDKWNLQ